jgi:hypothetical protein
MLPKLLFCILLLSTVPQLPVRVENNTTIEHMTSQLPQNTNVVYTANINGYTFLCGTISQSTEEESPLVHSVAFFAKMNQNGELLWLRTYWGDEHNIIDTLIEIDDGYLLAGSCHSRYGSTCMIIKTNFEGNQQWIKYFTEAQAIEAKNIIIIGPKLYEINGFIIDWESNSIPFRVNIDSNGSISN